MRKLTARSSLKQVAAVVADALDKHGIRAILTGGACASFYTRGSYQSADLDFILQGAVSQAQLDAAMAAVGFQREVDHYVHSHTRFFVEFPAGPLAIGADYRIQPVEYRIGSSKIQALSATDACRDRLAAFYFWSDRQSLRTAVDIARVNDIDLDVVRGWSLAEGFQHKYEEFIHELRLRENKGD